MSKKQRTGLEIVVQNEGEPAAAYREELKRMMDEVSKRDSTVGTPICIPTSDAHGRMTTFIQWVEWIDEPETRQKT